jgi:hypothetical protein
LRSCDGRDGGHGKEEGFSRLDLIGDFSSILPKKHRKAAKMGLSELLKAKSGGKNR